MDGDVQRKVEMVDRVLDFTLAHPFAEASGQAAAARLQEGLTRGEALAVQQRSSEFGARAANARRSQLRGQATPMLRHLVRVAEDASGDDPALSGKLGMPPQNGSHPAFVTTARTMVKVASANRDLFVKHCMPESMLDELGQVLNQYERATEVANGAKRDRIAARGELEALVAAGLTQTGVRRPSVHLAAAGSYSVSRYS